MRPTRRGALITLVLLVVGLGACGGDDDELGDLPPALDDVEGEPTEEAEPTPTPEPAATEEVYEVQSGDTLWDIAREFGTTVDAIVEANDLDDPEQIFPGDELVVPVDG